MREFSVGDRVKVVLLALNGWRLTGKTGTVVRIGRDVGVDFDNHISGHDCRGAAKNGHGWYVDASCLKLIPEVKETIVIYRDGQKTVSLHKKGKEVIKKESARCCPDNEYDFMTGAKIAFERLIGQGDVTQEESKEVQRLNGKVVCIKTDRSFLTAGKIYEFKHGLSIDDIGGTVPFSHNPVSSCDNLNLRYSNTKFIPLVE